MCAVAATPCYITGGIYQLLYKRCSVPDPNWSYIHTSVSHGLRGDRKKELKAAEVGGEPSVGERPQLPAAPLRIHHSTRSAGGDLTGA